MSDRKNLRTFKPLDKEENDRINKLMEDYDKDPLQDKTILEEILKIAFGDKHPRLKILKSI